MGRRLSEEELLANLRDFAQELGRPPTSAEMNESGPHHTATYQDRFGSWNSALETAGLEPRTKTPDSEFLDELRRLSDELGRTPKSEDMDKHGRFGIKTYHNRFGSWNNALEKAGLDLNLKSDISDEELISGIISLASDLDRTSTSDDMKEYGPFSTTPYENSFGT